MSLENATALESLAVELGRLTDEPSRQEYLDRHPELLNAQTVEKLSERVRKELRIDARRALALAESAYLIAQQLGDPESQARSSRAKANALWFNGEHKAAVELHESAAKIFEQTGNRLELGRTLSASIQPLILLGEYDRAFAAAQRAESCFRELGDSLRLARLQINIGNIFHRQDRFSEALVRYEKAYEELSPDKDAEGIASALHNIAVSLISLNDFHRALDTYKKAREFCQSHAMPLAVAQADYNIAYLHYLRGEYSLAIEMLRATRENCEKAGDPYHAALCYLDLSEIYLELTLSEEAGETAQEAHTRFERLGMGYESAKALANLAISFGQQGKAFRALELFAQSRAIFEREKNLVWPSLLDLYQALVLFDEGRYFESRRLAAGARQLFSSAGLVGKETLCRLLLGRLALKTDRPEEARSECAQALAQVERLDSPVLTFQAHFLMGEIEEAQENPAAAQHHYRSAQKALETLRSSLRGEELKISFMRNRLAVYERLVSLCLAGQGSSADAWSYMEQAKSRALRELMLQAGRTPVSAERGASGLVHRIRELREELNWYYHRIEIEQLRSEDRSSERIAQLQDLARQSETEFLRSLRELPVAQAESEGIDLTATPTIEMVREVLSEDTTLIEYFRVGELYLAAVLTRSGLEIRPLTPAARVDNLLRLLRFQFSKFRVGAGHFDPFKESLLQATQAHLADLYSELLAPLRPDLRGDNLVIVPHGPLHYLPFHALYDGEKYLVDRFGVSYAPSASVYALCQKRQVNSEGPSLILGVPDPRTPFILREVQAVAAVLPKSEVFLGEKASEEKLQEVGPQSRFVHIATHGQFREDNPMFSGIRMGNSYLKVCDLYYMRLPAELVTLSGCATGLTVVTPGDELLGLVRGLLGSGARSLLLTLWEVHDKSTAAFMRAFYQRLKAENKVRALQGAMHEIRGQYPHPFHWAPFVLIGKSDGP